MTTERSLVLLKPDAVKRGIIGKIITRFEDIGLKIIGMKMVWADDNLAKEHYKLDEEWAKKVYEKSKATYEREGKTLEYKDHMHLGKTIQERNITFITEGPVIAIALEGPHAVELVRKMIGSTEPRQALPGTIRSDFASIESYAVSDGQKRVMRNLVHASDSPENGQREIALWFGLNELHSNYKTLLELSI
jgi:nucleoside-diphosphate kinase